MWSCKNYTGLKAKVLFFYKPLQPLYNTIYKKDVRQQIPVFILRKLECVGR